MKGPKYHLCILCQLFLSSILFHLLKLSRKYPETFKGRGTGTTERSVAKLQIRSNTSCQYMILINEWFKVKVRDSYFVMKAWFPEFNVSIITTESYPTQQQ